MNPIRLIFFVTLASFSALLFAEDRILTDRSKRGSLVDEFEKVRGDSGKWRDDPSLQVAPALSGKPRNLSLDAWADEIAEKRLVLSAAAETWLIFRTRQLDDNDRLWISKIQRDENQITIELNHAVWQGDYSKNFTWYGVYAVNLGKLPAGDYEARWIVKSLTFKEFEDPKNRRSSWPKEEKPAEDAEPEELKTTFSVSS